jgi:hypothetical protein
MVWMREFIKIVYSNLSQSFIKWGDHLHHKILTKRRYSPIISKKGGNKMLKKSLIYSIVGVLLLTGCDNNTAKLTGQAFLKTQGGTAKTCAGNQVFIEKYNKLGIIKSTNNLKVSHEKLDLLLKTQEKLEDKITYLQNRLQKFEGHLDNDHPKMIEYSQNLKKNEKKLSLLQSSIEELEYNISQFEEIIEFGSKNNIRTTICDAQGNFEFSKLVPAKYYISTKVEWMVGDEKQGGIVFKIINIENENNKIIITDRILL